MVDISAFLDQQAPGFIEGEITQGLNLLTTVAGIGDINIIDSETFLPIFFGAQPMRVSVRETSKVMSHPVETGVTLSDHHVIEPKDIDVSLIIPGLYYLSVYQQIKTAFNNANLLILQTNAAVYDNLIVAAMPHEESPERSGVLVMALHLREVLYVAPASITTQNTDNPSSVPSNYSPADPASSNTVERGLCTATNPTGNALAPSPQKPVPIGLIR